MLSRAALLPPLSTLQLGTAGSEGACLAELGFAYVGCSSDFAVQPDTNVYNADWCI